MVNSLADEVKEAMEAIERASGATLGTNREQRHEIIRSQQSKAGGLVG